jgi:FkbM family methyltransferase
MPYMDRSKLIRGGVWSHPTELKISSVPNRNGQEWAVQVEECRPGETGEIRAVDIGSILAESSYEKISILKMDIEGAEAKVFSKNFEQWLPYVDNIVIELHDYTSFGPATDLVLSTISAHGSFEVSRSGELTVFKRPK